MQYDEIKEVSEINTPQLNDLDSALEELGMLASSTNSRNEYLKEISAYPCSSTLKINTKYISNVMIACGKYKTKSHSRFMPYMTRVRNRTKSENNDNECFGLQKVLNDSLNSVENFAELKKAKSLESIVNENKEHKDFNNIHFDNLPELETVSECIQNLKFGE
ncbi:uncharacterized protein LOC123316851 [Coccinella septempunctata]|uniref:uncharacterized protein LOC123316851 n=1 Tax=Coccinella septempunctata TaxID=41139 RepID=UPI001D0727A7|nr:uncharacterized protein LOC123316851 [Coccinella septempunctata]